MGEREKQGREREGKGNKEGVEVKGMKEEREETEGERKITFCRARGKVRERGEGRERKGASREKENRGERRKAVKGRRWHESCCKV